MRSICFPALVLATAWLALEHDAQAAVPRRDYPPLRVELGLSGSTVGLSTVGWVEEDSPILKPVPGESGLEHWVPEAYVPDAPALEGTSLWKKLAGGPDVRVEENHPLLNGLVLTQVLEADEDLWVLRFHCRLENQGSEARNVAWFPVWHGVWELPGGFDWIRSWKALSYDRQDASLTGSDPVELHSRVHSSDSIYGGVNPYWVVGGGTDRLYFAIEWCGGWQAKVQGDGTTLRFDVWLPPEETELTLQPGESIEGPVLHVTPVRERGDTLCRADWLSKRARLARRVFGGPEPQYPLAYNNWYNTRFSFDGDYLRRQLEHIGPYGFDAFVVDAGWYKHVGDWTPDPEKFDAGEFESFMAQLDERGVIPGIWSCPQFVQGERHPMADQPGFYRDFIDGYLVDMAGKDFTGFLNEHVQHLRDAYHAGWWKYDQDFFTGDLSHGRMKNVVAFQNALRTVRRVQPRLIIENCQSGGRMINEFTALLSQTHWLRDGGQNGSKHALSNFRETLGAMDFLFPWGAMRWTNNPHEMLLADEEGMRKYCRSAMGGTWGIVDDLSMIEPALQAILLREIGHYRRLNAFKDGCLYVLYPPERKAEVAGFVFYKPDGSGAAALLLRWDRKGSFDARLPLPFLKEDVKYEVEDVDTLERKTLSERALRENGLPVYFYPDRRSAIVFAEETKPTPAFEE